MLCVLDVVVRVRVVCCVVVGTLVHTGLTCCTRFFWSPDDWTAASSAVMLVGALHPHGIPCHVVKLPVTLRDETQRIGGVHECPIHTLNLFVEHVDNVAHAKTCPPKFQPNKKFMWTRQKEERPQRLRNGRFFFSWLSTCHASTFRRQSRFTTADCFRHRFCFRTHP